MIFLLLTTLASAGEVQTVRLDAELSSGGVRAYRLEMDAASEAKLPILGWQKSTTRTVAFVTLDDDGRWRHDICTLEVRDRSVIARTHLPAGFVDHLPAVDTHAELDGDALRVDLGESRVGWAGDGGALPETAEDPAVVDHEGDGRPGATVEVSVTGFGTYGVEVVHHSHPVLIGTRDGDGWRGQVEMQALDQRIIGADNKLLVSKTQLRPRDAQSTFALWPTDATSCADLAPEATAQR